MNFKWIPESRVIKRIEQLNFHRNIQLDSEFKSPTLKFMKETQKVKRMKELYESELIIESYNRTVNHWIGLIETHETDVVSAASTVKYNEKKYSTQFKHDLIKYEKQYITNLEAISSIFAKLTEKTPGYLSMLIKNCHMSLSGCVSEIIDLHKNKLLPKFQSNTSCTDILQYILQLIENNEFYCYVTHAMLYNTTLQWLDNYKFILDAFDKLDMHYDKLKSNDIILLYRDWTDDLCNQLLMDPRENADDIALCMDLEQKLCKMLHHISDAKKIACIKEVSKNNIEAIEKLYHVLEKKQVVCHPMLILFPRYDAHHGYRTPIDCLKLGQFVRIWNENSVLSETSQCYYNTNLFIFERCVIYTVIINENHFVYNGHFWIKDSEFESVLKNDKPTILAILKHGDRKLILESKDFVSALMRLHELHQFDEIEAEIEIPFENHVRILSKIDAFNLRRLSLAKK